MKCVECHQRKGKRYCPALNHQICAQCCGEKRVIKIPCTPDCAFLTSGQAYHGSKKYTVLLQSEENPQKRIRMLRAMQELPEVIIFIEQVIVQYASSLSSIKDSDVLESVQLLRGTYQTEEKGIIYQEASSNPLAEGLAREMRSALERARAKGASEGLRLGASTAVSCLEVVEADIRYYVKNDGGSTSYLNFVSRNHPEAALPSKRNSLIIAP